MIIGDYGEKKHVVKCDSCGSETILSDKEYEIYEMCLEIGSEFWCDDCIRIIE